MSKTSVKYNNEKDKCYGLTGMAIALMACDGERLLSEICLDAEAPNERIVMSSDYFASGSQMQSAKIVWVQNVTNFKMTISMILGNVLCRNYVLRHSGISRDEAQSLRKIVREEGERNCSLDVDEIDEMFEECLNFADRLFRHSAVQAMARDFSTVLQERRKMTASEIFELLNHLGNR